MTTAQRSAHYLTAINGGALEPEIVLEIPAKPVFPSVPDGQYRAQCIGCDVSHAFQTIKIFYKFRITDGPCSGIELFRPYRASGKIIPGKGPGTGPRPQLSRNGDLAEMLRRVFHLDATAHRISHRALVGKICAITTRTVTRDGKRREREPYSVVADVLSVVSSEQ